ncbi:hypothetical protein AAC387_Pa02g4840 [Persea americana]
MEINLILLQTLLAVLVAFTWLNRVIRKKSTSSKYKPPPEIPGARFIMGHLHLLKYPMRPHRHFAALAQKYGPMYIIRAGVFKTLVVSDAEIAKECFTSQDLALASRPISFVRKMIGYCAMFAFSPCGSYWREARKIATSKLLTAKKLEHMKHVRAAEAGEAMKSLLGLWVENGRRPVSLEMNNRLEDLVFNIVKQMVAGRRCLGEEALAEEVSAARAFRKAAKEYIRFMGVTIPYDALPFLGWLDLKGDIKSMKKSYDEMDSIMQGWVDEHQQKRKLGLYDNNANKDDQNFIDALLDMEVDGSHEALQTDVDTVIKATAMNLIIAGTENPTITMIWTITLLLKNPCVLEKAQEREDCIVGGYHVSRGTRLVVNAWMIQRDPRLWSDPDKFCPERFIGSSMDIKGQSFEVLPFGSGRRMCPGLLFALQVLQLTLAQMLHAFDWMIDPVAGIDMEEGFGPTLTKLNPLRMQLKPRLPEKMYASM